MAKDSNLDEQDVQDDQSDQAADDSDMFAQFAEKYSKGDREIEDQEEEDEADEQEEEGADGDEDKGKKTDGEEDTKDGAKDGSTDDLDEEEILKSLDPKVRALFEKTKSEAANWQHRYKSDEGRVSALQKKINKLEEQTKAPAIAPADLVKAFKDKESWKEFSDTNPEIAAPIAEFMEGLADSVTSSLQEQKDIAKSLKEKADVDADLEAEDLLETEHPGWKETVMTEDFKDWLAKQPASTFEIVNDGTAEESVAVITNFKNYLVASGKSKPPEETEEERKAREKVERTKNKRSKQLEAGAVPPSKGGATKPTGDLSTESLFDHFASKKVKR